MHNLVGAEYTGNAVFPYIHTYIHTFLYVYGNKSAFNLLTEHLSLSHKIKDWYKSLFIGTFYMSGFQVNRTSVYTEITTNACVHTHTHTRTHTQKDFNTPLYVYHINSHVTKNSPTHSSCWNFLLITNVVVTPESSLIFTGEKINVQDLHYPIASILGAMRTLMAYPHCWKMRVGSMTRRLCFHSHL